MSQSNELDPAFGHWLAGFIDGEGSFGMTQRQRSHTVDYGVRFGLEVRADEYPIMEEIHRRTGGLGSVTTRTRKMEGINASPHVSWTTRNHADCLALVKILDEYPLRAKKKYDYAIWREAVILLAGRGYPYGKRDKQASARLQNRLGELREALRAQRPYKPESVPPSPVYRDYEEVPLFEI